MTNRDKINGMNNKELAEFIAEKENQCAICVNSLYDEDNNIYYCKSYTKTCSEWITEWLKQEVKE